MTDVELDAIIRQALLDVGHKPSAMMPKSDRAIARAVRAATIEECAKVCDEAAQQATEDIDERGSSVVAQSCRIESRHLASAIRALGER